MAGGGMLPAMTREVLNTDQAPAAIGPYSQSIRVHGTLFFMSGQIPLNPAGELVQGDIKAQTEQVIANMKAVLASAGLTLDHVVKTTVFLSDMSLFADMNEVYGRHFTGAPPCRSTVAVKGLPRNVDVEIEAIAVY